MTVIRWIVKPRLNAVEVSAGVLAASFIGDRQWAAVIITFGVALVINVALQLIAGDAS